MFTHVRVKVCGVTSEHDARQAADQGADAVGVNFYPKSPRHVPPSAVPAILRALPPFVDAVGVFVNLPLRDIAEQIRPLHHVRTVQWHGDNHEPAPAVPFRFVPAFAVRDRDSLSGIRTYLKMCSDSGRLPDAVLVDAHVPGIYGGTGRTAPWHLLADFRPGVPLILAGGLTPDNVAEAVRTVRPYGVDVASGVESSPGRKDPEKMRRFIANAREAAARLC
jgi:phosphoribosylanthranilate isomerase